ncbi:long-chain-fatty-acid--CoA ligase ACSBG2-like isoform X2 [Latimeria chalumnae]|uniref:Long-chain-fatty-acid--CoA ligase ACSBG1 n=1 Tax=Latimeria chalumnae TaxID=7897 RepID=H3A9S1_LATCH|nr:PREDICTED: long-chain-fatty-acid--CoA ligase ACSBG2-like isoform X2 [Latimeria chalumnae]|eukprot:XP_006011546.1 PREDICTED: long-chain-fatty-acid--CoA ligase ACSBG2-like isoform X2 [Latimeria chalumnae]
MDMENTDPVHQHTANNNENIQSHTQGEVDTSVEAALDPLSLSSADSLWTTCLDGAVKLRMDDTCPEIPITVHQMFKSSVEKYGNLFALASKKNGEWEKITFSEYYHLCRKAAKSFLKLGLQRFHSVAILGFNSAEWMISTIGSIFAGGLASGIYITNSPKACHYVASDCKADIVVVADQKQLDKILQVKDQLPHLKAIVQYKGQLVQKELPNLYTWDEFLELGNAIPEEQLDEVINSQHPNQCCVLIYTSGTTGIPKGAMLSHDNVTWTAALAGRLGTMRPAEKKQEVIVSYLPLSHIGGQLLDIWIGISLGVLVYFAEPDALKGTLVSSLIEACPTSFTGVPRVWEKMMEKIKDVFSQSRYVKRKLLTWATSVSREMHLKHTNSGEKPLKFAIADKVVLQKIRAALGLSACENCFSGAAPIAKETLEFFLGLNIKIYEVFGMSETSGLHTKANQHLHRLTSCGVVAPGCKVKIRNKDEDGTGELCCWGRNVFMGYLNMEDETLEAFDEEGWLCTGDTGKLDGDGFLYITGRIKELIITAGGENVPPLPIEDAVKTELPIISNAMLIGDKRKFLSMLLTLKCDMNRDTAEPTDNLTLEAREFCKKVGSSATKVSEIVGGKDQAIYHAVQKGINEVNTMAVSNAQRIQKWTILERDFSIPGGELGPTLKLKRPAVLEKYKHLIDQFYMD